MAWPRALCAGTSNNPRTASSARLGRIQSPEILEHEPSLLRRKPGQLFPRGIAQPGTRAGRAGLEQRREVHAVAGGGATGALFVFVGLTPREGPAGVEQPAVQPLLTLDRLLVETARVQLARQLARLLRQRARRGASALGLQPLELLRERPLARRDRAQLREHRLTARAHHGQQPARLAVQPLLVARHAGELLDRFREPAPRLRARDLAAAPRECERRGVERVHGLFRQRPGLSGVRLSLLQLLARRGHLALRKAERALELRRDERVLPRRLADLPLHRRRSLLDRRLARPRRGTALSAAQRFGHLLLAVGERRRLRQRAVERAERLLAPRAGERVAPRPQRLGEPRQLLLRGLPGPLGAGLVGLPGGLGGPLHRGLRLPRGLLRRRERRLPPGRRPEVLPHLLDAVRQRVRPLFERALPRRRRAVRAPRVRRVPFGLAPLQVFRVGRERSQRTLRCGALEQLAAPLQLGLELLLRFGKPLQRLSRGVGVELGERLLQLAEPLLELGRDRTLQQLLHLAQPLLERGVVDPRRLRGARDLLHRLGQLLHALLERLLLARHRLRPLGRLERQRAGLGRGWRPAASCRLVARALLRQIAGTLAQVALRARDRIRGLDQPARRGAHRRPQFLEARQPQGDLRAPSQMRRRSVIPRLHAESQRVARQQATPCRVQLALYDGAVADAAHVERLARRIAHLAGPAHAPAHYLEARQPVVIAHVDHQGLAQRQRQGRVTAGHRHGHDGGRVGHHTQRQLRCFAFEGPPVGRRHIQAPDAGGGRRQAPSAARARDGESRQDAATPPPPRGRRERHARGAVRHDHRALGHQDRVGAGNERLVGTREIRRIARRQLEVRHERGQGDGDAPLDAGAPAARRPQEYVGLDRPDPADRTARGIERQRGGAPRL